MTTQTRRHARDRLEPGFGDDVYLTYVDAIGTGSATSGGRPCPGLKAGWVVLGVTVEPLVAWLWAGGLVAGLGGRARARGAGASVAGVAVDPVELPVGRPRRARGRG